MQEKERIKQEERDRKRKEEQDLEDKLRKERETLDQKFNQEQQKQRSKEVSTVLSLVFFVTGLFCLLLRHVDFRMSSL